MKSSSKHFGLLTLLLLLGACQTDEDTVKKSTFHTAPAFDHDDWYRDAVFYELFVRSYQDSNGDGIGDFNGLTSRLDHLARLGVTGLWLMPMYPTPYFDSGYDIADYEAVNPEYGTEADFDRFVAEAHKRNIRVFLDLVINHTSYEHKWFKAALADPNSEEHEYYVFSDTPSGDPELGPPVDCPLQGSIFGAHRWTYVESLDQYYFHQFFEQQPDLNFRSEKLRNRILQMVRFWFERGVDGFRLDVPYKYYEDNDTCDHLPETYAFIRDLRSVFDEFPARAMVGETAGSLEQTLGYLGNGSDSMHMTFDLPEGPPLLWSATKDPDELDKLLQRLQNMRQIAPDGGQLTITSLNHDFFSRTADILERDRSKMQSMIWLQMTLPGTPFMYFGEEIGLRSGIATKIDIRDKTRQPMQWDAGHLSGFTTADEPWIDMSDSGEEHVAAQDQDPDSLLNFYRFVIGLRNDNIALRRGDFVVMESGQSGAVLYRRSYAEQSLWIAISIKDGSAVEFTVPEGTIAATDLVTDNPVTIQSGKVQLTLDAGQAAIIQVETSTP